MRNGVRKNMYKKQAMQNIATSNDERAGERIITTHTLLLEGTERSHGQRAGGEDGSHGLWKERGGGRVSR